ncbi:MAG: translation initiation factor IF-5A [Candidatus Odinarchaeia archaeon]
MSKKMTDAGSLKTGKYIICNDEPCKIVNIEKSKAGKHGHAKVRVTAIGVFDGNKRSLVFPTTAQVEVPLIDKRNGQVISVTDKSVTVMDLESYETIEMLLPDDEELKNKIASGAQVEYWDMLGRKKITRVKSA